MNVVSALDCQRGGPDDNAAQAGHLVCAEVAHAVTTHQAKAGDPTTDNYVAHSLRADGFDASEDGTGRGTPIVPMAYQCHGSNVGPMGTMRAGNGNEAGGVPFMPVAFAWQQAGDTTLGLGRDGVPPVRREQTLAAMTSTGVRRLTPRECERLQGFPDDYTLVPHRGKPASDGPRYRALGNSMAVPVMAWIGTRIQMVEDAAP